MSRANSIKFIMIIVSMVWGCAEDPSGINERGQAAGHAEEAGTLSSIDEVAVMEEVNDDFNMDCAYLESSHSRQVIGCMVYGKDGHYPDDKTWEIEWSHQLDPELEMPEEATPLDETGLMLVAEDETPEAEENKAVEEAFLDRENWDVVYTVNAHPKKLKKGKFAVQAVKRHRRTGEVVAIADVPAEVLANEHDARLQTAKRRAEELRQLAERAKQEARDLEAKAKEMFEQSGEKDLVLQSEVILARAMANQALHEALMAEAEVAELLVSLVDLRRQLRKAERLAQEAAEAEDAKKAEDALKQAEALAKEIAEKEAALQKATDKAQETSVAANQARSVSGGYSSSDLWKYWGSRRSDRDNNDSGSGRSWLGSKSTSTKSSYSSWRDFRSSTEEKVETAKKTSFWSRRSDSTSSSPFRFGRHSFTGSPESSGSVRSRYSRFKEARGTEDEDKARKSLFSSLSRARAENNDLAGSIGASTTRGIKTGFKDWRSFREGRTGFTRSSNNLTDSGRSKWSAGQESKYSEHLKNSRESRFSRISDTASRYRSDKSGITSGMKETSSGGLQADRSRWSRFTSSREGSGHGSSTSFMKSFGSRNKSTSSEKVSSTTGRFSSWRKSAPATNSSSSSRWGSRTEANKASASPATSSSRSWGSSNRKTFGGLGSKSSDSSSRRSIFSRSSASKSPSSSGSRSSHFSSRSSSSDNSSRSSRFSSRSSSSDNSSRFSSRFSSRSDSSSRSSRFGGRSSSSSRSSRGGLGGGGWGR